MTTKTPPYTAILPTILCQQPAVILHWLKTERATGNLPVEIVLDVLIELVSRQTNSIESKSSRELINAHNAMYEQLEVYKRAVTAMHAYRKDGNMVHDIVGDECLPGCMGCLVDAALAAVDKLEGK